MEDCRFVATLSDPSNIYSSLSPVEGRLSGNEFSRGSSVSTFFLFTLAPQFSGQSGGVRERQEMADCVGVNCEKGDGRCR